MVKDEEDLFDSILTSMKQSRSQILENKKCIPQNDVKQRNEKEIKEENTDEIQTQKKEPSEKITAENNNPLLLVTKDIPEFVGTDTKKYNLRKNDIISTPKDMANMLCSRDAVEMLEL